MTASLLAPATEHSGAALSGVDVDLEVHVEARLHRALRDYLGGVARHLGVGPESCTLDLDLPISAYLALDKPLPDFPDRDAALLWDEVHGWAAAIETHSGEDLIIVAYLDTATVTPSPRSLARFVRDLRLGGRRFARPEPRALRGAGGHQALARDLEAATVAVGPVAAGPVAAG